MKLIGMLDSPYVRRVAISLAHTIPPANAATPICQGANTPSQASRHTAPEAVAFTSNPLCKIRLRSTDSQITPATAPNSSIGKVRSAETIATANADPVT